MNPEDNIKNFFQSRLQDNAPEAADWNIPSDDIWKKAKVDFPKEDRRRKPFFLFFFGILGLVIMGTFAYSQLTHTNKDLTTNAANTTAADQVELQSKIEDQTQQKNNTEAISVDNNNGSISLKDSSNPSSNKKTGKSDQKINRKEQGQISKANIITNRDSQLNNTNNDLAKIVIQTNSISDSNYSKAKVNISDSKILLDSQPSNSNTNISLPKESKNISEQASKPIVFDQATTGNLAENNVEKIEIFGIEKLQIKSLDYSISHDLGMSHILSPIKTNKKWEVGISTSPLVIPFRVLLNSVDSIDSDIYNIKLKYIGLNLPITRIINDKWSFTSGLYYKGGNLRAQFHDEEVSSGSRRNRNVSLFLDSELSSGGLTINDNSQKFQLNLKPDEFIREGDRIKANGNVQINFNALQIPLLVNYHIRKNRLEYIFSAGFSLDFVKIEIGDFDVRLSKDNRVITEPVIFPSFSERFLAGSLYGAAGTKFHFSESVNMSYTIKLDLLGAIFSTHEIGLHHRF